MLICKVYQEVPGEPLKIPADLLVQPSGRYPIELSEIGIQYHALPAHHANSRGNLGRRLGWLGHARQHA